MAVNIRIHDVLCRRSKRLERGVELFPVARAVQDVGRISVVLSWIERGPAQCIALAVAFEDDWAMTRHSHFLNDSIVFGTADSFSDFDLLATYYSVLPASRCLILLRIVGIKLLDIQILHVWS